MVDTFDISSISSQRTICFPLRSTYGINLGMKLKGFGKGKYNGYGGKFDRAKGDVDIEDTAIRELEEESTIQVHKSDLKKLAIIDFIFPYAPNFNQRVHIYIIRNWKGRFRKTDEMAPRWFDTRKLPYDKMWDSDKTWMPKIISGETFYARFFWKEDNEAVDEEKSCTDYALKDAPFLALK